MSEKRNVKVTANLELRDEGGNLMSDWQMSANYYNASPEAANAIEQATLTPVDALKLIGEQQYGVKAPKVTAG